MDKEIRKWKKKHAEAIRASMANPGVYYGCYEYWTVQCIVWVWLGQSIFEGTLNFVGLLEEVSSSSLIIVKRS